MLEHLRAAELLYLDRLHRPRESRRAGARLPSACRSPSSDRSPLTQSRPRSGSASACSAAPPSTSRSPPASSPRCGRSARSATTSAPSSSRCSSGRGILTDDIERVAGGQSFFWRGRYEYDLNVAHTEDTQLGVFAEFEPKLSDALAGGRHPLPRQHPARPAAPGPRPVRRRQLQRPRLDEPLDRDRQGLAAGGDRRGRLPGRQRRRDPPADRRVEPGPGRPRGDGAGPARGDRQAGRVRRGAVHRERLLRPARLPARGRARPDRRRRQLRRRLLRLPRRPRRRPRRGAAAAGDGLRHRARLLQRRGVRDRAGLPAQPRGDRRALRGAARG